jgi:class 3 adenylate cyclase
MQAPAQCATATIEKFPAAVLFADVSGFTALTERLAARGPAGAEELVALLNTYFGQLIDLVTSYGGDVVKFAGDAVLALWPATSIEDMAQRAQQIAQCCVVAQERLHDYPVADDVRLSVKLAIGAGEVTMATLGGVFGRWEFLVAGPPLAQVGAANHHAGPGQIYVSPEAWGHLQERCTGHREEDGYVRLTAVREALPFVPAPPALPTAEAAVALRAFIPGAIRTRLDAGQTDWLAELRRVTVLFINLPDFNDHTPLEQAQEAMMALQTNLYRYEGSINKISVDDKGASLVAALGLPPLAHEDDGVRGVRAAMAMQAELRKLGMRSAIGVTTGQAFCGSIGNAIRREYTLMGDVVNLAARLMQAAADDILCDAPTARSATGRVQLTALTPIHVKGKQEPIAIYRPAPATTVTPAQSPRAQVKTPMVGRASERAVLAEQLALLVSSGHGSRLIVAGEAGIGKSRLLDDLIAQARAQDVTTLVGAGDAIERTTPYYPWRRVFSQIFHLDGVPDAPAAKRTHVLHQLPPDPLVLQLSPLLSTVLALEWPDNEFTRGMTGKARADKMHEMLVRLLQATADQAPIVLVMEDLHWLDSGSLALLLLASQRVQPLLLVVSTRPMTEPLPADYSQLLQAPTTQTLQLANMPVAEALELVCRRLGIESLPEPVATLIRDKAEGNPFFSEELALAMRDAGLIQIADG